TANVSLSAGRSWDVFALAVPLMNVEDSEGEFYLNIDGTDGPRVKTASSSNRYGPTLAMSHKAIAGVGQTISVTLRMFGGTAGNGTSASCTALYVVAIPREESAWPLLSMS